MFTSVLLDHYGPPSGYCFDLIFCDDDPIIDDESRPDYNVPDRVKTY
jgi:hypothetical protein